MTVCGIKHADGVCVMGECPHFKKCCPVVWDKSSKPMTNEEWLRQATTDGMTEIFMRFMFDAEFKARFVNGNFINEFRKWLKEIHHE